MDIWEEIYAKACSGALDAVLTPDEVEYLMTKLCESDGSSCADYQ